MDSSTNIRSRRLAVNLVMVGVLLLAALLRWSSLAETNAMLHHDEAYNGVDALALIDDPHLTVFFPGNFGREAGWIYWLVPFLLSLGARPFALRLAASFMGILAVAATFRLGKELLGSSRGGAWAALALAVLYWHVHLSTLGLRATMMPLVGAMAFAHLVRAQRTTARDQWAAAGCWLGLLAYTYFSARSWTVLALLVLGLWLVRSVRALGTGRSSGAGQGPGIVLAGAIAAVMALPLTLYSAINPASLARMQGVAAFTLSEIVANARAWALAWFHAGDANVAFNPAGRPILDPLLGILVLLGSGSFPWMARFRRYALWPWALLVFALLPSLLSDYAPHFLRAIGAVLPLALFGAAGALLLEKGGRRIGLGIGATLLPLFLLLGTGAVTFQTYHNTWVKSDEIYVAMEQHTFEILDYLEAEIPPGSIVYFSPLAPEHPNLRFHRSRLSNYQTGAFDSHQCLLVADEPAVYASLTMYEPSFAAKMAPFTELEVLDEGEVPWSERPAFTIFAATPRSRLAAETGTFGGRLQVELLDPLPETAAAGSSLPLMLRLRPLRPLDTHYNVFVHLYTIPPPEAGGSLVTQADELICPAYPTPAWKLNEAAVVHISLPLPPELPAGEYLVATGIYESRPPHTRLPLSGEGVGGPADYLRLGTVRVVE